MSYTFRTAVRENIPLIAGLAGGTGSGKTLSALKLAKGLAGGEKFAIIDTENGRAKHYADDFDFDHADLRAPFRPEAYLEAIKAADAAGYGVVVVDSFSHEYAGEGGLLDWHEEELTRMAGNDYKRREAMTFAAWVKPKMEHKRLVQQLLQLKSHLIVCLRAEEKIEIVKRDGRTEVVPKKTLSGHVGWIPVAEKSFAYELTLSLVLTPDAPGVPKPIKLQEQHRALFPLDKPIAEEAGKALAEWARGGKAQAKANPAEAAPEPDDPFDGIETQTGDEDSELDALRAEILAHIERSEPMKKDAFVAKVEEKFAAGDKEWLEKQLPIVAKWPTKETAVA